MRGSWWVEVIHMRSISSETKGMSRMRGGSSGRCRPGKMIAREGSSDNGLQTEEKEVSEGPIAGRFLRVQTSS